MPNQFERPPVDQDRIVGAICEIIAALDEDPGREGLRDTPSRVARMYAEVFSGMRVNPVETLQTGFEEGHDEMVVARDIPFFSMCEHHFLPFFGVAHIGYIPQGRIVGISKLARVTDIIARRPQLQERMTTQIADAIVDGMQPMGVGVVVEAEHLCMVMRGIKKPGSRIVTSVNRGNFRSDPRTRAEFLGFARDQH
ncbi:MAG: GTP cyclohydrolase I FolE [Chloroflexota bacterium]